MKPAEFARSVNEYITDHVKFADAKAASILGFNAVVVGAVASAAQDILQSPTISGRQVAAVTAMALVVVVCASICTWYGIDALQPRLTLASPTSLSSFPNLARMTTEDCEERTLGLCEDDVVREYARHNVVMAKVADAKFTCVYKAVLWLRVVLLAAAGFVATLVVALTLSR